jgi:hypothetical protein
VIALELTKPVFPVGTFELQEADRVRMRRLLAIVGQQVVDYLQSLTEEMRPPVRAGGAQRAAHPGHWADVTGELARNYRWHIEDTTTGVRLVLSNETPYAVFLEAHDGFFVLSGVADEGGPVQKAMREVMPQVAPGWEVRYA